MPINTHTSAEKWILIQANVKVLQLETAMHLNKSDRGHL